MLGSRVFLYRLRVSEEPGNHTLHTVIIRHLIGRQLAGGYLASTSAMMRVLESALSVPPMP